MEANPMKLQYRGVSYNYNPATVETTSTGLIGKFRGAAVNFRTATQPVENHPAMELIYRGVHYRKGAENTATIPQTALVRAPYELVYRGVRYQSGTPAAAVAQPEQMTETVRQLTSRNRLHTEKREMAVLGRFAQAVAVPERVWTAYDLHQASAS
jgi:hypothetical protein